MPDPQPSLPAPAGSTSALLSLTPDLPLYIQARAFLTCMQGVSYRLYRSMYDKIWEHVGNPRENVDWTVPAEWIPLRLTGAERDLALKIWTDSANKLNPRYTRGCWYLLSNHHLLEKDSSENIQITSNGRTFLSDPEGELTAQVDKNEGLLNVLAIVSEHNPGRRGDILPDYSNFCNTYTNYRALNVHKTSLYDRLVNLLDRKLISRNGVLYEITDAGQKHLAQYSALVFGPKITPRLTQLQELAQNISQEARTKLADYLSGMNPYDFEWLVKMLLEEIGYANVTVTSPSNDRGVDVVGDIELGISKVREVVQVKRHAGAINRTVLDGLRGSLHRFKALRGTIITTGSFSAGTIASSNEIGAAPITLIDGKKLIELLVQYEIGVTKKTIEFSEFDDEKLKILVAEHSGLADPGASA